MSGIRTHDPGVREGKHFSCLRPSGHCDRQTSLFSRLKNQIALAQFVHILTLKTLVCWTRLLTFYSIDVTVCTTGVNKYLIHEEIKTAELIEEMLATIRFTTFCLLVSCLET
jgi:hypothetical protein